MRHQFYDFYNQDSSKSNAKTSLLRQNLETIAILLLYAISPTCIFLLYFFFSNNGFSNILFIFSLLTSMIPFIVKVLSLITEGFSVEKSTINQNKTHEKSNPMDFKILFRRKR